MCDMGHAVHRFVTANGRCPRRAWVPSIGQDCFPLGLPSTSRRRSPVARPGWWPAGGGPAWLVARPGWRPPPGWWPPPGGGCWPPPGWRPGPVCEPYLCAPVPVTWRAHRRSRAPWASHLRCRVRLAPPVPQAGLPDRERLRNHGDTRAALPSRGCRRLVRVGDFPRQDRQAAARRSPRRAPAGSRSTVVYRRALVLGHAQVFADGGTGRRCHHERADQPTPRHLPRQPRPRPAGDYREEAHRHERQDDRARVSGYPYPCRCAERQYPEQPEDGCAGMVRGPWQRGKRPDWLRACPPAWA